MKWTIFVLGVLLMALNQLPASSAGGAPPAFNYQNAFSYQNPLNFNYESNGALRREVRDPCIIREGDTYYATFTMWPFANREEKRMALPDNGSSPGIALYSSKDLKEWKLENWLVKSSELPENSPYKHRFWAPEIHKIGGKFYLIFTADNWLKPEYNPAGAWGSAGYAFVGVADKITGPYRHITYMPQGACDTTLFGDSDGKIYAVMPKHDISIRQIDLSNLENGEIKWLSDEKKIVACKNDDIGLPTSPDYLEGPWLEKIGTKYFLFYAAIYKDKNFPDFLGYKTGVAYAGSIAGPWKKDARGQVFYGGHLAVFDGPNGGKWFSYRIEHTDKTRGLLAIDPLAIDAAGRVQSAGPTSTPETVLPPTEVHDGSLADTNLRFIGRWDKSDGTVFHSHWGGAYLRASFSGNSVAIKLAGGTALAVSIDGEMPRAVNAAGGVTPLNKTPLAPGVHSLLVGSAGQNYEVAFQGLQLDPGATTSPVAARPLIEFIGDSITTGGGQTRPMTVNYAWMSAEALGADHTQIAFSGRALTTGFGCAPDKAALDTQYFQMKNFNHLQDNPPVPWDFSYTPQIVVINLGQNDQCGAEPPETLTGAYVAFVQKIRARFPNAYIVALRPFGGAYENAIRKAVDALSAAGDKRVQFVDTTGWLDKADFVDGVHPSEAGHTKVATRLIEILKTLPGATAQTP